MPEPQRRCPKCGAGYGSSVIFCPADGTPLSARAVGAPESYLGLRPQDDITLEALIGVGAMASVFRAHQSGVERAVAVKILHPDLCRDETLVARFQREGRAAARVRHPNVIEVHAIGNLPPRERSPERQPYLVLEYLDGLSLRSLLSAGNGSLPLARALHIVLQLCDALGEAHARGIVHRDLKPENLMLVRRGDDPDFVKVLDFGLSRVSEVEAAVETRAGAVLGTARYVSPEGARGEPVDARADVYAIGTILFECLAGRTPFEAESAVALLVRKAEAVAPDVRDFGPARETPAALAELVARCLAREPERRPQDGRALGRDLLHAAITAGLGGRELSPRPTLFGAGSLPLPPGSETRLFGSPEPAIAPPRAALETRPDTGQDARARPPLLRRVAIITACFVLGASGALGVGSHFGGCGR
ncbi:MAG TPA: serine/threonine-protein kinase [Polyangiaceae bacterium]